jgi:mannose-6-phosphate isomerase-like protein (cupin superfamily)
MSIYRIYFSESDSRELGGREGPKSLADEVDFSEVVVDKPWGHEYLMYRNAFAQLWSLRLHDGGLTSMHCHPRKKTALIVVEGRVVFSTLNTSITLEANDSVMIDSGVFHATRAVGPAGARVFEIETPPLKHDLIRLMDAYGRAGTFYEGRDKMRAGVADTVRFAELGFPGQAERAFGTRRLAIVKVAHAYTDGDRPLVEAADVIAVLEGDIRSRRGELLHSVADVVSPADYHNNLTSHVFADVTLLVIRQVTT